MKDSWEKSKTKFCLTRELEKRERRMRVYALVFVVAFGIAVLTHYYFVGRFI